MVETTYYLITYIFGNTNNIYTAVIDIEPAEWLYDMLTEQYNTTAYKIVYAEKISGDLYKAFKDNCKLFIQ